MEESKVKTTEEIKQMASENNKRKIFGFTEGYEKGYLDAQSHITELEKENQELREAMREIASLNPYNDPDFLYFRDALDIANKHLNKILGRCMTCKEDITPSNNGMSINNGEYFMCNDCHFIEHGVNIMGELLCFKSPEHALNNKP